MSSNKASYLCLSLRIQANMALLNLGMIHLAKAIPEMRE